MDTFNTVFSAFVEAEKAMHELPQVKAKLADAEITIAMREDHIDQLNLDVIAKAEEISALSAKVAQLEAALAEATFRGKENAELVTTLRRLLGVAVASDPILPVSEPIAEPQGEPKASTTSDQEAGSSASLGEWDPAKVWEEDGQPDATLTPNSSANVSSNPAETPTNAEVDIGQTNGGDQLGESVVGEPDGSPTTVPETGGDVTDQNAIATDDATNTIPPTNTVDYDYRFETECDRAMEAAAARLEELSYLDVA